MTIKSDFILFPYFQMYLFFLCHIWGDYENNIEHKRAYNYFNTPLKHFKILVSYRHTQNKEKK